MMRVHDETVRTTVDLPPALHQRVLDLATQEKLSMSRTLVRLAWERLDQMKQPSRVLKDPVTGLPMIRLGRPVTVAEVTRLIDDDA